MKRDKIDIEESEDEVVIRVDTSGVGRAMADAVVHHARRIARDDGG